MTMIQSGPMPRIHDVVRWRVTYLCQLLWYKQLPSRCRAESFDERTTTSCWLVRIIMPTRKA